MQRPRRSLLLLLLLVWWSSLWLSSKDNSHDDFDRFRLPPSQKQVVQVFQQQQQGTQVGLDLQQHGAQFDDSHMQEVGSLCVRSNCGTKQNTSPQLLPTQTRLKFDRYMHQLDAPSHHYKNLFCRVFDNLFDQASIIQNNTLNLSFVF